MKYKFKFKSCFVLALYSSVFFLVVLGGFGYSCVVNCFQKMCPWVGRWGEVRSLVISKTFSDNTAKHG